MILDSVFGPLASIGPLLIRLSLASIFIVHGYPKLFTNAPGLKGFSGALTKMGVPLPFLLAAVVGILEFFGGIALGLGIATRWLGLLLAIHMIVAILLVTQKKGFTQGHEAGYEFNLLLLAGALMLLVMGPGPISIDWAIGIQ
ncbi:MAG: DoxX family protein [Nitrospinota bacterium]